jgi:Bacterial Ig-like domain
VAAANIFHEKGASGLAIPSTVSGKNVNESYLGLKNFSPIPLSNVIATQLPSCPNGFVTLTNPLGNDMILIGGLDGSNDTPYFIDGQNIGRGTPLMPGSGPQEFRVTNSSVLQAIASRNGDIIQIQGFLSGTDFQTPTSDPPPNPLSLVPFLVAGTTPVNGATGVFTNQVIEVVFNRAVTAGTADLADVSVVPEVATLAVYVDPTNPAQVDIDPSGSNLSSSTLYTVTLPTNGIEDQFGNGLVTPYTFTFTTGGAPPPPPTPTVSSCTPGNNASGVALSSSIVIVMNTPVISGGVTSSNVKLIQVSNGSTVASSVTLAPDNETVTIDPTGNLSYSTQYYVKVSNLENLSSVVQSPNPWNGSTVGSGAGEFTTTAQTFTTQYNVAQNTSPCASGQAGFGPPASLQVNVTNDNGPIGVNSDDIALAYGESATSANGLTNAPIVKVVLAAIFGDDADMFNADSVQPTNGNVGIQIINSSQAVKYTFVNSFNAGTASGFGKICTGTVNQPGGGTTNVTENGWTSVTIEDTANVYTMAVGDLIMVTWSGTGGNVIAVGQNTSGIYGKAYYLSPGTSSQNSVYNIARDATVGNSCFAGFSCDLASTGTTYTAFGEIASAANGLTSGPVTKITFTVAGGGTPGSITISVKILNSSGTVEYTFVPTYTLTDTSTHTVTLTDTANTYTMSAGGAIVLLATGGSGSTYTAFIGSNNSADTYGKACYWKSGVAPQTGSSTSGVDLAADIYVTTAGSPTLVKVSGVDIAMTCYSTP